MVALVNHKKRIHVGKVFNQVAPVHIKRAIGLHVSENFLINSIR